MISNLVECREQFVIWLSISFVIYTNFFFTNIAPNWLSGHLKTKYFLWGGGGGVENALCTLSVPPFRACLLRLLGDEDEKTLF